MRDILGLRKARGELVDKMEGILAAAGDVDLSPDEQKAFDDAKGEIDVLDGRIKRLEDFEAMKVKNLVPAIEEKSTVVVHAEVKAPKAKGTDFARIVRCLAASKGNVRDAAHIAETMFGSDDAGIAKAMGAATGSAGGFLVPESYSSEIIELLRNQAIVRRAGAMTMPLINGNLSVPKLTAGSTASYIGENSNISSSQPSMGQIRMTARTLAALVPISNQLIRFSSPQADSVVRDDLVSGLAVTEDAAFLRDQGLGAAPKGIRYWANSANVFATAGTSAANVETDLKGAINKLESNNVRMIRPVWFLSPRTKNALWVLRDANGNLVFPEIRDGNLWGYPVFVSNNVPTNLGGGAESEIYLVDMADAVIAEDQSIVIDVSDTAAYHDGSNVIAAFSQDQTVVRAIMRHDFAMRHDYSAAVVTGVAY
jgi:HK97 family phage major capsid protein